ncbi:MAG: hypothetical protein O7C75_20230 [Verrucomicrobia bacterium]|nr:hypothetical protein [Verrucomicrobiota bacterium]
MEVSDIVSALTPLQPVETTGKVANAEELKIAAQKFEAVLLRQFLGQALKPLLHNSPGSNASGAHIYQYMLTDTLATQLSTAETFGLSTLLQMQLSGEVATEKASKESPKK